MTRVSRGSARLLVVAGAISLTAVSCLGLGEARAAAPLRYTMTASADTVSLEVLVANAPLVAPQLAFVALSSAQAHLDSFGGSTAFAGEPFVGHTIENVGGLVNGLGGGAVPPLPASLPGYVTTSSPANPTADASQGPYHLRATSGPEQSAAAAGIDATTDPAVLSGSATARTAIDGQGRLIADATSISQPFAIGGLLELGTVRATAKMTRAADGSIQRSSSLDLGTITIAGVKVGLADDGIHLLGGVLPGIEVPGLRDLLASAGISIELLPGSVSDGHVTSEGVRISVSGAVPVAGASSVAIVLGRATATLDADPADPPVPISTSPSAPIAGAPRATAAPNGQAPSATPVPEREPSEVAGSPVVVLGPLGPDALGIYLLLLLAGGALFAASSAASRYALPGRHRD